MEERRTNKRTRRHARWDRIFMVLIALVGIIGTIAIIANAFSKKKAPVEPSTKPDSSASAYFQEAIAQEKDNAIAEESAYDYALLSGADISKHNGDIITNGDFVIVKATEGVGYVDPRFKDNIENAINNGQLAGV